MGKMSSGTITSDPRRDNATLRLITLATLVWKKLPLMHFILPPLVDRLPMLVYPSITGEKTAEYPSPGIEGFGSASRGKSYYVCHVMLCGSSVTEVILAAVI